MIQKIFFFFTFVLTVFLYLFLNGNLQLTKDPLPPLGKFLNPFYGVWTSDSRSESQQSTIVLKGIKDRIEIYYDDMHVPHIFAQNLEDALFAQGYVEAQNRLFQMEFLARAAAGELSSIFGEKTLKIDLERRRMGMKYAAENAVKGWKKQPDYYKISSYIDGINAYISSIDAKDYPIEYKLFDIRPETWTPLKSALIFKQMSLTLAGRNDDIQNTNLLYYLGKTDYDYLYPEHQQTENAVIPTEHPYVFDTIAGIRQDTSAYYKKPVLKTNFTRREKGIGSNSWGLAGRKTQSGNPIFCNDPHLSLGLPSIWIEEHIQTPEFNAYGVSFPGFPGIMIGFNENMAWGETNVGQDVEDLFVMDWVDKNRIRYRMDGKEYKASDRIETIRIKGKKDYIDTVKYTILGPVYYTSDDFKTDLAMRWICHDEPDTDEFNVFIKAMSCKNTDEYLENIHHYISPAQNFGFADKKGNIGLRVNGRFPAKFDQDGRFVEYASQKNNWQAWIPQNQIPQSINPERGFIASANQVSTDKTYPYYYTGRFERYRNKTINSKLENTEHATVEDMKAMQFDTYSSKAYDFIQMLQNIVTLQDINAKFSDTYDKLLKWDCHYKASYEIPVLFELFSDALEENTWDEISKLKETADVNYPEDWRLLELINSDPDNKYFDIRNTSHKENAKDIVIVSINQALDKFLTSKNKGENMTWGAYKPLNFFHMTRIPALSELDVHADGCVDAINAVGVSFGPSWRMIISLDDKVHGIGVYPGGQSGNPTSKYYKNKLEAWLKGQYYPLHIHRSKEEFRKSSSSVLQLIPES